MLGYRVLRFKLRCHRTFERRTTSNQDVRTNDPTQWWKIWSRTSVPRGRGEVTNQLPLCNGATQVLRTTPTERRGAKEALPKNRRHRCQRWIRSESRSTWTEWNQRQTAMVFTTSSRHKPAKTRKSQKSVQRSSKVSRCSPKRQISTWARPAAQFDRNHISLPKTPNSLISRYGSNVSSSS